MMNDEGVLITSFPFQFVLVGNFPSSSFFFFFSSPFILLRVFLVFENHTRIEISILIGSFSLINVDLVRRV